MNQATHAQRTARASGARRAMGALLALLAPRAREYLGRRKMRWRMRWSPRCEQWPEQGVPANPEAWLLTVARRKADRQRATAHRGPKPRRSIWRRMAEEFQQGGGGNATFPDRRLALMLVCTHPQIDPALRNPINAANPAGASPRPRSRQPISCRRANQFGGNAWCGLRRGSRNWASVSRSRTRKRLQSDCPLYSTRSMRAFTARLDRPQGTCRRGDLARSMRRVAGAGQPRGQGAARADALSACPAGCTAGTAGRICFRSTNRMCRSGTMRRSTPPRRCCMPPTGAAQAAGIKIEAAIQSVHCSRRNGEAPQLADESASL